MFKTAATKIAHNSTLPALGGNKDLRPLQDLIMAEKAVLVSLQKLSVDFGKAADALRAWGSGEGEDLTDTLSASTNLLNQFSASLSTYASHEHAIRDHMKNIRSREEALDELKRRRKALISKADAAEKKLSKMSPEHKNLGMQTETLNRLRDEIRSMDSEIMSDEASLGDFKRTKAKSWMGLKFGGLLECCEKGTIIGEFGRLVIAEISEEPTQPGYSRAMYMNHQKVGSLVSEATRCIEEVAFSTVSAPGGGAPSGASHPSSGPSDYLGAPQSMGTGHFLDASDMTASTNMNFGSSIPPSPISPYPASSYPTNEASRSTDDFGTIGPSSNMGHGASNGGRFATFPVKTSSGATGYSLSDGPPSVAPKGNDGGADDSFSSSVAAALNMRRSIDEPAPSYETHQAHLSGPPPGAAPPLVLESPWEEMMPSHERDRLGGDPSHTGGRNTMYGDDVGLAYDMVHEEEAPNQGPGHARQPSEKLVRFGSQLDDIDTALEKRHQQEHDAQMNGGAPGSPEAARDSPKRIPPPTFDPASEERALNAAAAREISREMDALNFSPPTSPAAAPPQGPPRVEISPERGIGRDRGTSIGSNNESHPNRTTSPLIPPVAPFAQRGVSPGPIETDFDPSASNAAPSSPLTTSPVTTNISSSPPRLTLPDRTQSSLSNNSFRTPPEYPRSIGASPFGQRSTSSLTGGGSASAPSAPGKISAAAFRRPAAAPGRSTSGSSDFGSGPGAFRSASPFADTSPLAPKKRGLPTTPYPAHQSSLSVSHSPPGPGAAHPSGSSHASHMDPGAGNRASQAGGDDHYDYISAYTDAPPGSGSPQRSDFGSLGQIRVANDPGMMSPPANSEAGRPGYEEGRFATNLESDLR